MPLLDPAIPLAQTASVLGWSLVVILLVVAGFAAVSWVRKWMKEDDVPRGGIGFTLGDLRQIHARGEISDEEFERARAKMTASAKAVTANMPDPAGGRRAPGSAKPVLGVDRPQPRERGGPAGGGPAGGGPADGGPADGGPARGGRAGGVNPKRPGP